MPGNDIPTTNEVAAALRATISRDLEDLDDGGVHAYLADAIYLERRRLGRGGRLSDDDKEELDAIEGAARAIQGSRADMRRALLTLVDRYAHEIHNRFSERTYKVATRLMPSALSRLLTAAQPKELLDHAFDPGSRVVVQGPLEQLRTLSKTHTLVLAPTHVSNLDSPLLGYAMYANGLPPVIYGAGLNLFNNPAMAFFMGRLGAYTVDRRKKHTLYKNVLKAYSSDAIARGRHSLFFPGGTRARSGRLESRLKKGLLGTAIGAWQQGLRENKPHPEVLVVPATLSFALVLEAETLIEDALEEEGKSRYIISDDEFSDSRTVASFTRRVLNLDASMYVRFGQPMDLIGNPVDAQGRSLNHAGDVVDRRQYVTDRSGRVVRDPQRDQIYTDHLATSLAKAYRTDTLPLATNIAGKAAWELLGAKHPRTDTWQRVFLGQRDLVVKRSEMLTTIDRVMGELSKKAAAGEVQATPEKGDARAILDKAIDRFGRYHKRRAIEVSGADSLTLDPRLNLYYGNRLSDFGLEGIAADGGDQ